MIPREPAGEATFQILIGVKGSERGGWGWGIEGERVKKKKKKLCRKYSFYSKRKISSHVLVIELLP